MVGIKNNIIVGIYQNYEYPNLYRQTPGQSGIWQDVCFRINKFSEPCDILVVLNRFYEELEIECGEVWLITQEPPLDIFQWVYDGHNFYDKVFSPLCNHWYKKHCQPSHGALPWHIDLTYDELKSLSPTDKRKPLSWITTNKAIFPGHKDRMGFLDRLRASQIDFDLFGRGFASIKNKYDGLAQYRYSLAIENYSGMHYWTEKVADCFLSWTMPIYCGCVNLSDYFPAESYVKVDIKDPKVFDHIKDIVKSDLYMRNREAIAEARRLVLDKYQIFPFIVNVLNNVTDVKRNKIRLFKPYQMTFKLRLQKYLQSKYPKLRMISKT